MNRKEFNKIFFVFVCVVILTLFQTTANEFFKIKHIMPDFLFAFTLCFACVEKKWNNILIVSVICGIISDFICHPDFWGCTAIYTYSAILMHIMKNLFLKPNIFLLSIIAFIFFVIGRIVIYPLFYITMVTFVDYLCADAFAVALYNTIAFFVMMIICRITAGRGKNNVRNIQ